MAQPLRIEDLKPLALPPGLMDALFGPNSALTAALAAQIDALQAMESAFQRDWPPMLAALKEKMLPGRGDELTPAIDAMLANEKMAAKALADFRGGWRPKKKTVPQSLRAAVDRVEDSLVKAAEFFRDARWDMINIRADGQSKSDVLPVTSLAEMRRAIR